MDLFKINIRRFCLLPVACCLLPVLSFSQSPSLQTTADRNAILIGEQVKVTVKANFRLGIFNIHWLVLPDSIPHFEIVEPGKADTITYKDNSKAIEQTITFTSFDSGKWMIPSFRINFDPLVDDTTINFYTDAVPVNVSYSPPDSTNQLRDIKPIMEVSITDLTWYYVAAGILLLLLIGFLIRKYMIRRKMAPGLLFGSGLSPYDEAIQELKKLEQYDLRDAADVKIFHTRLTEIFKRYLGRKQNKNIASLTTGDLLIQVNEDQLSKENISALATALRCSDAVKFAKYLPTMIESEDCRSKIRELINLIEQKTENTKP